MSYLLISSFELKVESLRRMDFGDPRCLPGSKATAGFRGYRAQLGLLKSLHTINSIVQVFGKNVKVTTSIIFATQAPVVVGHRSLFEAQEQGLLWNKINLLIDSIERVWRVDE